MSSTHRAVCVASVLLLALMSGSAAWGVYSKDFTQPEDFGGGAQQCLEYAYNRCGVTLSKAFTCVPYVWIPSADNGTVSKVDAGTGVELARYRIGPEGEAWIPSAIASDMEGNAYVACAGSGSAGKIIRIAATQTAIATATRKISTRPKEVMPLGSAACVTQVAEVGASPTSLCFDSNGYLWVSLWGDRAVAKVDPNTGKVVATIPMQGRPSYMVLGEQDSLWVLCQDTHTLCEVSTALDVLVNFHDIDDCAPHGLCMDDRGNLWMASLSYGLVEFRPADGALVKHEIVDSDGFSAVTIDKCGDIWACRPSTNEVYCFSGKYGSVQLKVPVGNNPNSICVDETGYVWALNMTGNTASRIDVTEGKVIKTVQTSGSPLCASSFASCVTMRGVCHDGVWRTLLDSRIPGAGWGRVSWLSTELTGKIDVEVRTADSPELLADLPSHCIMNGEDLNIPNGRYMEVSVRLTSALGISPVLHALSVEGRDLAPAILTGETP